MSDRVDHKSEALTWLETVSEIVKKAPATRGYVYIQEVLPQIEAWNARAQIHATLALVEEQRTANLIAFGEVAWRGASLDPEAATRLFCEIRDRLGLS